jgi:inhibitor of KinA
MATPGAWRLLGRTPLRMFRADHKMMGLISIGDQVRFRPISNREFGELERE